MSNSVEDKILAILNWAEEEGDDFDNEFVLEMQDKLEEFGELTEKQEEALDRIISGFRIDVDERKD